MEKVVVRKVFYRCSGCRTKYPSKREALQCERRTLEKKVFKVGSRVRNIPWWFCHGESQKHFFSGVVTRILGPYPADDDYEARHLGGKSERINSHVFMYQVKFRCPKCGKTHEARYYAPQLKRIGRR